jgi:uncharacterized protein YcbK (DUF882 family)
MSYEADSKVFRNYESKYFTQKEFACKCGKCNKADILPNVRLVELLDGVREYFGKPITINSGIRCPAHNKAVGGASKSEHMYGEAADIVVKDVPPSKVYEFIEKNYADFNGGIGLGSYARWTHVDVRGHTSRWKG